jgi:hypothetical protein
MPTPDQIIAGFLVLLGLAAGFLTLLQPLLGMMILIFQYVVKLFSGPISVEPFLFWSKHKKK